MGSNASLPAPEQREARIREMFRIVRREADCFEKTRFLSKQDMTSEVAIVEIDTPIDFRRTDCNIHNLLVGNNDGVKQSPALEFETVGVYTVFLP